MDEPSDKLVKQLRAFQRTRKSRNSYVDSDLQVLKSNERFLTYSCFGSFYLLMQYLENDSFPTNGAIAIRILLTIGLIVMAVDLRRKIKMINFLISVEEVDIEKALGSAADTEGGFNMLRNKS